MYEKRLKNHILNKPILYSFIIFMICLVIRIVEYFVIKTDTTFISENFIHKLIGIIILLFLLKIMNYKFKDIGFEKNKWFKYLIYGLILGGICFGISYLIEYITLYSNAKRPSFELYVNGFSLVGNEVKHTEMVFFVLCIILNIVNVLMEERLFRGFFLKVINNKNNKTIKIVIHPKQITISNKTYDFLNDNDNTYQKIDNILKNHIENIHKFKC